MGHNMLKLSTKSLAVIIIAGLLSQAFTAAPASAGSLNPQNNAVVLSGNLGGCSMFPANNIWNTPVDTLPVHARSDQWVNSIGRSTGFHMDFGSGTWDGGPIGIPFNIVGSSTPKVNVSFYYPGESDPGPYPIPNSPVIEYGSDHHILIVDNSNCTLYELYDASYSGGRWHAGSGAIWSLNSNALRPDTWTSADAAGLPILPGLVRYDEILAGQINHAIRFTAQNTNGYIWPARHLTSNNPSAPQIPPMGARFRLKASFNISGYPAEMQVILRAMKTYGIILADNGSNWYVSGAPDARWNNTMLHLLDALHGNDFEAVDSSGLMVDYNSGATGFTITGNVGAAGVTLSYTDGVAKTATSLSDGSYSLQVSNGWSGTVMPAHPCYTFNPANLPYSNVASNQSGQNYIATFNPASGCANVNVDIANNSMGNFGITPGDFEMPRFGMTAGPVLVKSTNGMSILTSQRAILGNSFNELTGFPSDQLATDYWFTYYDDVNMATWLMIGNPDPTDSAHVEVYFANGNTPIRTYDIPHGQSVLPKLGVVGGPLRVKSTNGVNIFTSERAAYRGSFNELMGYPANQLTTDYWFTYYDDVNMATWLMIGNPDPVNSAHVEVYFGNGNTPIRTFDLAHGESVLPKLGIVGGPLRVKSTNGVNIFTSERSAYGASFNELMGFPADQLTTDYWFTYIDDVNMNTWLMIGNPDPVNSAHVEVYLNSDPTPVYTVDLAHGQSVLPKLGRVDGPLRVKSTNGVKIFTSERAAYGSSFNELMGFPANQLTTTYWFTYYDNSNMATWLMIGAPN